jgi:predicted O-methyltransferase YrrM
MMAGSDSSMKIACAINESLNNSLTRDERDWLKKIEALRSSLKYSKDQITGTDYGAVSSNTHHSEKERSESVAVSVKVSDLCRASKASIGGTILFKLIRHFRSVSVIELGTCAGISAAYQAVAQKLNEVGRLTTLEGHVARAVLSENNLQQLGLDNVTVVQGRFQDNLDNVLQANKPVDFAFIDGHHDEKATIAYFTQILPYLTDKAIIVFDDISWSQGMRAAWENIIENEQVKVAVDLVTIGICVIDKYETERRVYRLPKLRNF